ncbi:hypothetical protein [Sporomusa sp.]|uniref:hypothetical protein n=1 Tax=Sporomusa sp. TaxID=2078658 RepID=UPI002D10B3E0|nr:hypothetical protein [Sporomusa sp.]HWR45646.1 hypothetical protein [Sporomusa sp.]
MRRAFGDSVSRCCPYPGERYAFYQDKKIYNQKNPDNGAGFFFLACVLLTAKYSANLTDKMQAVSILNLLVKREKKLIKFYKNTLKISSLSKRGKIALNQG